MENILVWWFSLLRYFLAVIHILNSEVSKFPVSNLLYCGMYCILLMLYETTVLILCRQNFRTAAALNVCVPMHGCELAAACVHVYCLAWLVSGINKNANANKAAN